MNFLQFVIISLHITKALSKRKYSSSSEESIENLLYYKDCQHRRNPTTKAAPHEPLRMTEPPRENSCPFPKMCCSMSCDDTCNSGMGIMGGTGGMSSMGGMGSMGGTSLGGIMPKQDSMSMDPFLQSMNPPLPRQRPFVPPNIKQRGRKKTLQPTDLLPPIGGRREFGFTKEKIKSLISQDVDIRKILKDLVRVTMQKVDLLEIINSRRSNGGGDRGSDEEIEQEHLYKNDDEIE